MKMWEMVKEVEEAGTKNINELGEAKATMIINFGEHGKCQQGLINEKDYLTTMIVNVFQFYEDMLNKNKNKETK